MFKKLWEAWPDKAVKRANSTMYFDWLKNKFFVNFSDTRPSLKNILPIEYFDSIKGQLFDSYSGIGQVLIQFI